MEVVDNMGRLFKKEIKNGRAGDNQLSLDISTIPTGSYFVKMTGTTWVSVNNLTILD